jgi:CRISPR/Cas system-associated exonuclease Cas4 (RecB family)
MCRAACPRKWYYRYALKWDRKAAFNKHLVYGSLMHEALAKLYQEGHYGETPKEYPIEVPKLIIPENVLLTPDDWQEIQIIQAKVQIAFDAYRVHYHKEDSYMRVLAAEEEYNTEWRGLKLQGRIDLVAHPKARDGIFIWDFKTAGRFDATMLDAWSFRFQFLYYCWLYWRCTGNKPSGTMANGLGKTRLKPSIVDRKTKQKETPDMYLDRIRKDMRDNRSKYFYRQRMPMVKGMLEKFENEILGPHMESFYLLGRYSTEGYTMNALAMSMNTGHCHVYNTFCEYLPLCKDGPLMLGEYNKREVKHVELAQEIEGEIGE